jgi:dipeptidyl aminopeptidase/acylaminoacyl peptidase
VLEFADRVSGAGLEVIDRSRAKRTLESSGSPGFAWSSDGKEVWYSGSGAEVCLGCLMSASLSGKKRLLYRAPIPLRVHDVSQSGRLLVSGGQSRGARILALPPGETSEHDLSWLDRSTVADLSADGTMLLFNESGEGGGRGEAVYLRRTDGAAAVRLGEGWATSLSPDVKWALTIPPDGSRLVLLSTGAEGSRPVTYPGIESVLAAWAFPDGKTVLVQATAKSGGASRLYVGDLAGGAVRPVTPEGVGSFGVTISPDGGVVTAVGPDRTASLYPADGNGIPKPIAGLSPGDVPIRFAGDGKALFVSRLDEVPATIFRLDFAARRKEVWKKLAPSDPAGVGAVRVIRVSADGRSYAYSYYQALDGLFLVEGLK